jgi:hypothetical protein
MRMTLDGGVPEDVTFTSALAGSFRTVAIALQGSDVFFGATRLDTNETMLARAAKAPPAAQQCVIPL